MGSTIRRMLPADEVAEIFDVTTAALRMQRMRGQAPGNLAIKVGKKILFDPADLEEYIEGQKSVRATSA